MKIDSFSRRIIVAAGAAMILAGCGGGDGGSSLEAGEAVRLYEMENDHAMGSKDAPVVVVEHASVVCPACANWHNTVFPEFKEKFIETGKVRFIFREFPTQPERVAETGFTIANCVDESKFFANIKAQFNRQQALLSSPDRGKAYEDFARASGLSLEEYEACLKDDDWWAEYTEKKNTARNAGVRSTPSFMVNGKLLSKAFTIEDFDRILTPILEEAANEAAK